MENQEVKGFNNPGEVKSFDNGRLELINFEKSQIGRFVLDPGWKWSQDVSPLVGTDLCHSNHFVYVVSGVLRWRMEDGTEFDTSPGQVVRVTGAHDAWVVGDEPFVGVDWVGAEGYLE